MSGRPTLYTEAVAEEILGRISEGETLNQICRDEHLPAKSTVLLWVREDREGISDRYTRARELQQDCWADDIIEIADDSRNDWIERETKSGRIVTVLNEEAVARSRIRVDNRKWLLSKRDPARFGDKLELSGKLEMSNKTDEQLDARIAQLTGKAGAGGAAGGEGAAQETP
jgi:hypothetical protein